MKTIREYLEELPEPYRTQALENYNPFPYSEPESLLHALCVSFEWRESKQGYDYWNDFYECEKILLVAKELIK